MSQETLSQTGKDRPSFLIMGHSTFISEAIPGLT